MKGIKKWAQKYIDLGWPVVPLAAGTKICKNTGWTHLEFTPDDFRDDDNIGLRSLHGLVIIDIDCLEAVSSADSFLPVTGAVYGRESKPRSKRLYLSKFPKTIALKDLESGTTLIEIRSEHQDMAPPSVHPGGEPLSWDGDIGEVAPVDTQTLLRATRLIATCSVISRYYNPPGNRHEWGLALAGTLRRCGVTEDECILVFQQAAKWAHDSKVHDRLTEVHTTYSHGENDPYTGGVTLAELSNSRIADSLYKIWGKKGESEWQTNKHGAIQPNSQFILFVSV